MMGRFVMGRYIMNDSYAFLLENIQNLYETAQRNAMSTTARICTGVFPKQKLPEN